MSVTQIAAELIEVGDVEAAIALLEPLTNQHPQVFEYRLLLASAYSTLGDHARAMAQYEAMRELDVDDVVLDVSLGMFYASLGHMVLAAHKLLQVPRSALAVDSAVMAAVDEIHQQANEITASAAEEWGISSDQAWDAFYWMEMGLVQGHLLAQPGAAIESLRKAAKAAPRWGAAYNELARFLFFDDQWREAVDILERFLIEVDRDDLDTLSHLAFIYHALGEAERVRPYYERLRSIIPRLDLENVDVLSRVLEGLAAAQADEEIYQLLKRTSIPFGELDHPEWLGTAAANLGYREEALKHWQAVEQDDPTGLARLLAQTVREEWGWPPDGRFPYFFPAELIPTSVLTLLEGSGEDKEMSDEEFYGRLNAWGRRYPYLVDFIALGLWHPQSSDEYLHDIVQLLFSIASPRAVEFLRMFATGQRGPDEIRLEAATALANLGALEDDSRLSMWLGGRWQEISVLDGNLVAPIGYPYDAEIAEWLQQALHLHKTDDSETERQLYEKILARNPNVPEAYVGLANLDIGERRFDAAMEHLQRAIQISPDYGPAYLHMALIYLEWDEVDKCLATLERLSDMWLPPPLQELRERLWVFALSRKGDQARVLEHLDRLAELAPDDPEAQDMIRAWKMQHLWRERWLRDNLRRRVRMLSQPITGTDLESLLPLHNKENLVSMARALGIRARSTLRKADLVRLMAQSISEPKRLRSVIARLSDSERAALRRVLEAGGMLPYDKLVREFGGEPDEETTYWSDQEPESVLGRLRWQALLFAGTREGRVIALIADELRPLVEEALAEHREGGS